MALALWAAAAASESRLVSQPALLAAAWVALFMLPAAYAMCRCDWSQHVFGSITPSQASASSRGLLMRVPALVWRQRIRFHSPVALQMFTLHLTSAPGAQDAAEPPQYCSCHAGALPAAASMSLHSVFSSMMSTDQHTASLA